MSPARRPAPPAATDARSAALAALERILASGQPADRILGPLGAALDGRDRALLHELTLGTLRWLRRVDHVLAAAADRPVRAIDAEVLGPLRLGAYQLLFLDRVPAHAAVDQAVRQVRRVSHRGAAGFANAVLRRIARRPRLPDWPVREDDPVARLGIETSHPDFLVRRWRDRFGSERAAALLAANNEPRPIGLLAFRHRGGRRELARRLAAEDVETSPSTLAPEGLVVRRGDPLASAAFRAGDCYVQDEASQAVALLPPPEPGERILDAAAAPGGKSLSLISFEPAVRPVLADRSPARLGLLAANLERLGLAPPLVASDAARPGLEGAFDRVVLDIPCSGTGTLRKHPELKWRLRPDAIGRLAAAAAGLLDGCAPLVAPGGLLAVISCSLEPEENERLVESLTERRGEFAPLDLGAGDLAVLPPAAADAIEAAGRWRLLTGGDHDGFTAHVLRRRGGGVGGMGPNSKNS